jgi:hypothetical protein
MSKVTKKHIIIGVIGITAIIVTSYLYSQYKKIMDYDFKFKSITKSKLLRGNIITFNIFFDYINKSDIGLKIVEQDNEAFVNGNLLFTFKNKQENLILPNSSNVISANITLLLSDIVKVLGNDVSNLLIDKSKINIDVKINMKIEKFGIKIPIKFVYKSKLSDYLG